MAKSEKHNGRPPAFVRLPEYQVTRRISIDNGTADFLRSYGNGNLSAGIRRAAGTIKNLQDEINK